MQLSQIFSRGSTNEDLGTEKNTSQYLNETLAPVQIEPIEVPLFTGHKGKLFIDGVSKEDGFLAIHGWSTLANIELILHCDDEQAKLEVSRHAREDVCHVLGLSIESKPGFSAMSPVFAKDRALELEIRHVHSSPVKTGPLAYNDSLSTSAKELFPKLLSNKSVELASHPMGSRNWWEALVRLPIATKAPEGFHGFIEGVIASPEGNGVIFGWAIHKSDTQIWIESSEGDAYPLDQGFRRPRQDTTSTFFDVPWRDMDSGFILHIPHMAKGSTFKLCVATDQGKLILSEKSKTDTFSIEPQKAAAKLFSIESEQRTFQRRARLIDWPVLESLINRRVGENDTIKSDVHSFGKSPSDPLVSLVVPLYKRFDFIEHQILEFIRDQRFSETVELFYVVDDPDILEKVLLEARKLFSLYHLPFKVIDGHRNRGFSGANNLGAAHASGEYLLFLNSDVIPRDTNWLSEMLEVFNSHENTGAVGARLLYPDGGIQHAGMKSVYLDALEIWSNQHPGIGMSPDHDDNSIRDVPSLTGACLLMPRSLFNDVGGWDTGYLLGDFEDSDLCFSIRKAGFRVMYQPKAELTHLERQSFVGVGSDHFRLRMTICNAVRHEDRWSDLLKSDAEPESTLHTTAEKT